MSEEEYFAWFKACGFEPTGEGTEITIDMINDRGTVIQVPRPSTLTPDDRREACEGMSQYFQWRPAWGAH